MSTEQPRRSAYSLGSLPNMLRSMLVLGLIVVGMLAIVPRITQVDRPAVDAAGKGSAVAAQTGWRVQLPAGLGDEWVPTVATQGPLTDKVPTFTTVWRTPDGSDLALKQAADVTPGWIDRSVNDGVRAGQVTIGSRSWERYLRSDRHQTTYLLRGAGPGALTLAATTTGPEDELRTFLAALTSVAPAS